MNNNIKRMGGLNDLIERFGRSDIGHDTKVELRTEIRKIREDLRSFRLGPDDGSDGIVLCKELIEDM